MIFRCLAMAWMACILLSAQQGPPPPHSGWGGPPQGDHGPGSHPEGGPGQHGRGSPENPMYPGPPGKWWTDPGIVQRLGVTTEQQEKIETLFQQSRLKLIDLSAALEKQEASLDPLVEADHPDEQKVLAQIDRVAQARAELEKANARFLLGIRNVLTPDQWRKLKADSEPPRHDRPPHF